MNIAFIIPSLANKGPIILVKDLCFHLQKLNCFCKVFYFDNIIEINMPCEAKQISWKENIDFKMFDIIHTHMYRPDAYIFFKKPLISNKTKFITTLHQHLGEQIQYAFSGLKKDFIIQSWLIYLRRFDAIVTLNKYHQDYYKNKKKIKNTFIIFNGRNVQTNLDIDIQDKIYIEKFKEKYQIIGAIAYITSRKGYEQLIQALISLPKYGLLFVGDGPEVENLKNLSHKIGVAERCLWLGAKVNGYRYLKYIDIFAMTSRTEGFPLSLIEAAAYGKPVLCSNIPLFKSIVDDQKVCFFDLDNIKSLLSSLNKIESNKDIYSKNILKYYEEMLTGKKMAIEYISVYKQILNS